MRSPLQARQVSGHQSPNLATPLCYFFPMELCSPPSSPRVKSQPTAVTHDHYTLEGIQEQKQDEALCALDK